MALSHHRSVMPERIVSDRAIPSAAGERGELTLSDAAAHTGIPRDRILLWQSGGTQLRIDEEEKLARLFYWWHHQRPKTVEEKE